MTGRILGAQAIQLEKKGFGAGGMLIWLKVEKGMPKIDI